MTNAIEVSGLNWKPGKTFAIQDLDLTVPVGAIYGFLGPNGSGKTTTIRYHGSFYHTWDLVWAAELMGGFRLNPDMKVGRLSKGEKGKLLVLLALAQRPDLLLLDEPTDGLDPVVRRDVLRAILDYVSEKGATVFISSHLVRELERFCDWVGIVDQGRMVAELPMEIFKNEIKRVRVVNPPEAPWGAPFQLLTRQPADGMGTGEVWIIRGWHDGMREYFRESGAEVKEVMHLDVEEGFVELLSAVRPSDEAE